jgi:hypothetical protein
MSKWLEITEGYVSDQCTVKLSWSQSTPTEEWAALRNI